MPPVLHPRQRPSSMAQEPPGATGRPEGSERNYRHRGASTCGAIVVRRALLLLHLNLVPELQHGSGEVIGTILGKEQPSIHHFDHALGPWYGVLQPIRPLLVEEN